MKFVETWNNTDIYRTSRGNFTDKDKAQRFPTLHMMRVSVDRDLQEQLSTPRFRVSSGFYVLSLNGIYTTSLTDAFKRSNFECYEGEGSLVIL